MSGRTRRNTGHPELRQTTRRVPDLGRVTEASPNGFAFPRLPVPSATVNTGSPRRDCVPPGRITAQRRCDWALAGGVCVMGSPAIIYDFAKTDDLAVDGQCRVYADDSSGTLWGEGAGPSWSSPSPRATPRAPDLRSRSGQPVRPQRQGKTDPDAAPRSTGEVDPPVIDGAGIDAADVGMIEGHGTATRAGDRPNSPRC